MIKHILWKKSRSMTCNCWYDFLDDELLLVEYVQRMWRICEAIKWVANSSKAQEKTKYCKIYLNYKMISNVSGGYNRNR